LLACVYFRLISILLFQRPIARLNLSERPAALSVGLLAVFFVAGVGLMPGPVVGLLQFPAVGQFERHSERREKASVDRDPLLQARVNDDKTASKPVLRN